MSQLSSQLPLRCACLSLVVAVAFGTGCSIGDPDDEYYYYGKVKERDGTPIARATVEATLYQYDCSIPDLERRSPVKAHWSVTTAAGGDYLVPVRRYQLTPGDATLRCFEAAYVGQRGDVLARVRHAPGGLPGDVELPVLSPWLDSAPAVQRTADGGTQVTAPAIFPWPAGASRLDAPLDGSRIAAYDWAVQSGVPAQDVWRAPLEASGLLLPTEVLEDFPDVRVRLVVWSDLVQTIWASQSQYFNIDLNGVPTLVTSTVPRQVPVSRGARCRTAMGWLNPCPWTDGRLDAVALAPADLTSVVGYPAEGVELELANLAHPSAMVIRNWSQYSAFGWSKLTPRVWGSLDGTRYILLQPPTDFESAPVSPNMPIDSPEMIDLSTRRGQYWLLRLDGLAARHLLLELPAANATGSAPESTWTAAEVSVFEP